MSLTLEQSGMVWLYFTLTILGLLGWVALLGFLVRLKDNEIDQEHRECSGFGSMSTSNWDSPFDSY